MRQTMAVVTVSVMLALATACAPGEMNAVDDRNSSQAADAVESIDSLASVFTDAWNSHDMDAWGDLFTHDVDFVNRGGGWWRSNQENLEGHARVHTMLAGRNTVMDFQAHVASVDVLAPGVAVAHVTTTWPGASSPSDHGSTEAIMTWIVVETNGQWQIRAVHNTLVDPGPGVD